MPSLKHIGLGINHLKGNLSEEMCNQLPLLEVFSVAVNQLEGSIPQSISNCTSLKELYLDGNSFTGFIPKDIGNLVRLEIIDLGSNYLSGPIPFSIFTISTLKWLELTDNSLSSLLPSYLGIGLPNLETLWLDSNELSGQIPKSISNVSKLKTLDLSVNKLNGAIPNVIGNLKNLFNLALHGNDLTGLIPDTISNLHNLQRLSLSNNKLQGSIINELCQLKNLSELYLDNNMFSGAIPRCLGSPSLRKLNFSFNKLMSHIPFSLWSLKDILVLDISSNALSGSISQELSNFRAIILLNLSRNQLSGSIPTTMGSLQTLITLSLANNKLQGSIPKSFSSMISIESMDLSHNYLSGMIPKSLESLLNLRYINFSYNLLDGEIPSGGPFQNFTAQSFMMNKDLCGKSQLQVHPCRRGNKHMSNKVMLVIKCSMPIMVVILVVIGVLFLKHNRDDANYATKRDLTNLDAAARISYYELLQGTNRFDESNLLGFGSFGSVYKAILPNKKIVAVKVFNIDMEEAFRSFDIECVALCNLRHRNLIKIISCCSNDAFRSLIMEFMSNGSLDRWLYSHNYCLDILERLNIMVDVASALEYLHHGTSTPIVHCDIKPSNVLLDEDMVAHVSDFGIAKLLGEGQLETYTKTLATVGYIAPEYGSKGAVSFKGDVYSYGIMLMEMFTRKKPTDEMFVESLGLKDWVSKSTPHSIINILDVNLLHEANPNINNILPHMSSIFELALSCCTELPEARILMNDVVVSLKKIRSYLCSMSEMHH
ncbi:receptor kinase-like protein Xa21 [Neltuma alba]|uniref:receptor kinase-like protein Xa21 n=1 Tax=Neltuma alba TaxID=207710 RepID=UPI0010A455B4|nr:receptor kinase-like protein Xa21 [Prosopis alba]XP_028788635.1 receptor kinase-like protein Xa21 [Prosopis alba]XP_028788636.1 receptor kinase-like protein Xa21 [Prosopis alba]XP_028788637.1 receptor kinase-like protein Xa21 [Prosopis alba]